MDFHKPLSVSANNVQDEKHRSASPAAPQHVFRPAARNGRILILQPGCQQSPVWRILSLDACMDRSTHSSASFRNCLYTVISSPMRKSRTAGVPIGSDSMESQCSQFKNRLKRRGQFGPQNGFASLQETIVRHQNEELHTLWAA
jgi:hypothetical protein